MSEFVVSVSPASFVQRSMWASAQRFRAAPLNVMNLAWRIQGPLRAEVLESALSDVVARHPTLRARLTMHGGQLMQEVLQPNRVRLVVTPVEGVGIEERFVASVGWLRERARRGIDVVAGPPFHAHLLQLAQHDHLLCIYVHHAMCDGWSSQIIIRDLTIFYEARAADRLAELPPMAEQYSDIAELQIRTSEAGGYNDEINYWKEELSGLAPLALLPATGARKGNRDFSANSPIHSEPADVLTAIRETARRSRVSTFSFLLAALAVLLHERTGAQDLIVGVPTLNRWSRGAMGVVGCATSLLPARIRPRPDLSFVDLSVQVHATVRRLLAYGRIPLELLLRETQDSPIAGPLFPVWCQTRQAVAPEQIDSLNLTFTSVLIERGTILADLDVDMIESTAGLHGEFAHRPALFEANFIARLMSDYGCILRAAAQSPVLAVGDLRQSTGVYGPNG